MVIDEPLIAAAPLSSLTSRALIALVTVSSVAILLVLEFYVP
jgi:hypothetical protein